MSSKKIIFMNFNEIISRLKQCASIQYDGEIAKTLGLSKSAFSERKRRKSLPIDKIRLFCERMSINMDWLLTGEGDMHKTPEGKPPEEPRLGPPGINEAQPEYADLDEPTAGIPADYPLAKKLNAEIEDAARLGLTEEELIDILAKILEVEQIKRRRRPRPAPVPEPPPEPPVAPVPWPLPDPTLLDFIRRIAKEELPPEGESERRKCMVAIAKVLKESDIKGDISPEPP